MFSRNNTKMNNKKQFEKVNHYGIKKFNAGTASVLIASAFMFLGGAAQAADTNKQEATVATTEKVAAEKSTEEKAETKPAVAKKDTGGKEVEAAPKAEVKAEAKKEVNKATLQAKISQLDNLFVSLAGQELSEDKQVKTVSAAVELNKAKDLAASASATQEEVDAQVAALEAAINNLNKVEKTADKKEAKKEEKSETKVAKENLEKAVSEAKVVNQAATTFATKEVKEEAPKAEIKAAVVTSEKEIAKALDIFNSDSSTKEDADQQRKELEKAIEAVYVTMQRAGHRGKVETVLADTASKITGKDVFRDGETVNAVTNAYVEMNADNTAPTGWGVDTTISTSTLKAGSITKIELTNLAELGAGLAVNTEIRATDGTVVGKVKSIDFKTTTGNNNNKSVPYWAQRTQRGMTYDQRVAEQPAVANETGTYTYNIEWNDKVKDYPNVSFGASNLSGSGYLAPQISKDTPYTATIKIDGRTVLEHTYTRKGQQPSYQKQGTSASLSENNGLTYLNNEQIGRSDSIVLKTDSDVRYGVGSKFTIKLPNADFTEFKELEGSSNFVNGLNTASTINPNKGDSITYRPQNRWSNARANENNVWILQDGRDTGFTLTPRLISPTELELTVTEGTIQEDSIVSMPLQSLGIEKVIKDKTLTSEYSNITYENGLIKQGYVGNDKTAATLTVSGGESINGEKEDVITKVPNGWSINGDGKVQGEPPTGAVVRTFKDLVTGEVIGFEPTRYTGNIPLSEDGSKDYTNVLGNKYDVSNDHVDLVKEVNGEEYILADLPPENVKGTLSVTKTRARDLYSEEELKAKGINGSAFVTPAEYDYVKKTKVEEVNRTIKFVYADDVKDLAGTEVFPSQKQTVSYTGTIKLTPEDKAVVVNDKPVYIDWKGTNGQSTDLPELAVPQKEGYIASVEKVPVQVTTATDKDYEYVVTYTAIQKAKTTFVYQDKDGNVKQVEGNTPITETGKGGDKLTKAEEVANKIKEAQNKGYELVSNTYPTDGVFDKDKDIDQEFTVTLKERVVPVTPDQPKTPGTPVDPTNPEGPKYPAGLEEKDLNKTVTRKITYVYADGTPVLNEDKTPKVVTQEVKFTRTAKVNLVTKEVTYGDWSAAQDLAEVKSPEIAKHTVDKAIVPTVQVTNASENIKEVVIYTPVQKAITTFVYQDKDGNVKQVEGNEPISETGTNGEKLTKAEEVANKIKEAQNKGYEVVSNTYPTDGVFDKDVDTDQEYTVTLKERVVTVTPDQPKTPGTPVDPTNPEGPKYPAGLEEKDLNKTVTRKITYVYADGTPVLNEDKTPKVVTQEVKFTRTAKVNLVTKEVTYGDWSAAQDLAEVKSPVVKGYLADKATVPTKKVTADSENTKEVVTYKPLGSWVPNIPGQPTNPIKYPNDKDNPTKPGTEKPKVPYVPGFTPKDKDGNPLKPVNPNNPEEGYEVPNVPNNPGQDTPINYVKDTQKAKTTFVDEKGNPIPGVEAITEEGDSDTPLTKEAEVKAKIKELENKGYELVSNTYPEGGKFDKDKDTNQEFVVTLKAKEVTVTPDQPKTPGTPVDPNNPDGPKYPAGLEEKDLNKTVTRKITYVYADGTPVMENGVPKVVTQQAKFTREAKVNLVTGEVTYGKWTPEQELSEVKSPVVKGFVADKASVAVVNVTAGSEDIKEVVTYKPLGSWVPNIPGQPTDPIKYPNDPTDPTKPGTEKPKVPYVPGFTPKDKDGNPLKPVNPNNPEEGYEVPNVPNNPGQDTPINYVKDTQKAKTTFVDEKGNPIPGVEAITEEGDSDTPLTKEAEVKAKIKELENKGYELVSNTYPEGGKFDKDKDTNQEFVVTLKAKEVTVTPDQPKTPGTPVDPNNPEGPKYPAGLEEKDLNKTVTRKITYVYADGTPVMENGVPKVVTQQAKFTREAKVNLVTGEVTYGKWTPEQELSEVKSPVVKGFVADKASVAVVNVTAGSEDIKEVVTYKPLGSWVPNIPGQPTDPIKYPNDPTDPTKPGTEKPKVPYVPGFTPKDKDGNPLKPVNPNNPEEGYEVPNVPNNPGQDTPINYVKDTQKAKTTFVDEKGNPIPGVEAITEEGDSDTPLTKEAEVKAKIKELENKGYELVSNTYPEGGKFDKDKDTDQEFKVTLKAKEVTVTPDQPKTPGTPVDPNNPDGPKYPAGLEEKDLNKTVTRTITYVYEDGTPVLNEDGTPKTVTQEAKFTREAKVNLVTGEVTYGDWTSAQDLAEVKSPVVKGFVADKAIVPTTKVTADSKDTTEVVTYKPIGSWIPNIPGQPTNPIKYPNDPTDPTKPGQPTDVLPYVPGFTPEDKDGNPLKPVDPKDPSKGYVVPNIPTDPSQDTPINYVANKANLVVKYVDEKGKDLIPSETTEGKVGDEYSTSGKVIPGYVLVRVDGEAKGKIGKDGSTVTYVYKPLGSWIPNIPGQPTNPIKYPNDPTDPTKPGSEKPKVPYVPGFTPKDKDGNPLKPVNPNNPEEGYEVPNIPTNPGEDTPINYVANKANLVVKYVDEKGKDLIPAETTEGKVGDEYTTSGKVIPGYVLVRVDGEAKGKIGKEGSTVTYVYKPLGSWVPNIPGQPTNPIKYPNDPQDPTKPGQPTEVVPYVPGYTPVDGNGQPLKPVDPKDPSKGYEVPSIPTDPSQDTPINYVANKANLVVKYVDEKGKDLIPAETTEGKVGDEYTTSGKVIPGYVLVRVDGEAKGKIGKEGSTVTYVYKPLGSWVPNIPGQPTNPIKYPNDPTDPTKPGSDKPVLPYVPGHTPVDGNGQPLKPVDPQDPTKGYIVPDIPTNPGQDTPINYVANPKPQPKQDPKPEPNPKPQPNQDQKPQPKPAVTPEKPGQNNAPVQPKANTQVKRLANTGTTETNTGLAGLGLATFAGILAASRRRKEK